MMKYCRPRWNRSIRVLHRLSDLDDTGNDICATFAERPRLQLDRLCIHAVEEVSELHRLLICAEERALTHDGNQNTAGVQQVIGVAHMSMS